MRSLRRLRHELVQFTRKLGDIVTAGHTRSNEGVGQYALHSPSLPFNVKDFFSG